MESIKNIVSDPLESDLCPEDRFRKQSSVNALMESDPVVSSTVDEAVFKHSDKDSSVKLKRELSLDIAEWTSESPSRQSPVRRPYWKLNSTGSDNLVGNMRGSLDGVDFDNPEFEYDDDNEDWQFTADQDIDVYLQSEEANCEFDYLASGRITPDGLIDEDFEQELGWFAKELCIQEVIDSDFRDISRLGILQVAGDDRYGRKIIAVFACRLPSSDLIDHDRLLEYVKKTLEQYVSGDYCLVYFHWGLTSKNKPSFSWLVKAYRNFDRNFKKNLKSLIIVYPTRLVKIIWNFFRPFISSKMNKKLVYVHNLRELEAHLSSPHKLTLPIRIREYDARLYAKVGLAIPNVSDDASVMYDLENDESPHTANQQFGVTLRFIQENNGGRMPAVVEETITYLRDYGFDTPGLFLRSTSFMLLREIQMMYNRGEFVDLCEYNDPHLAATLLKTFLHELKQPLMTFEMYNEIIRLGDFRGSNKIAAIRQLVENGLPEYNYKVLCYIFKFLTEVLQHSVNNRVTAANLAVVFAPNILWSHRRTSVEMQSMLNSVTQLLITHFEIIFLK